METTQLILWILAGIGVILAGKALFQVTATKSGVKKGDLALLAAGQMLVSPYATFNLITESGILWKIVFVGVLVPGLIAVYYLANNKK